MTPPGIKTIAIAERRLSARAPARVSVGIKLDGQVTMAQTRDFSTTGVFIETTLSAMAGTPLEMFMVTPGRTELLRMTGGIARVTPAGWGVAFQDLPGHVREGVERFISSLSSAPVQLAPPESQLPPEFDPRAIEEAFRKEREGRKRNVALAAQLHQAAQAAIQNGERIQVAIELLERAIQLSPGSGVLHHELGAAYYELGDVSRAVSEFDKALKLDPETES